MGIEWLHFKNDKIIRERFDISYLKLWLAFLILLHSLKGIRHIILITVSEQIYLVLELFGYICYFSYIISTILTLKFSNPLLFLKFFHSFLKIHILIHNLLIFPFKTLYFMERLFIDFLESLDFSLSHLIYLLLFFQLNFELLCTRMIIVITQSDCSFANFTFYQQV